MSNRAAVLQIYPWTFYWSFHCFLFLLSLALWLRSIKEKATLNLLLFPFFPLTAQRNRLFPTTKANSCPNRCAMSWAKLCRRVEQAKSNLLNRITFSSSRPHTCSPTQPTGRTQFWLILHWQCSALFPNTTWTPEPGEQQDICHVQLNYSYKQTMKSSLNWLSTWNTNMQISLFVLSWPINTVLSNHQKISWSAWCFHSTLPVVMCLCKMAVEIQTQGTNIPEAKVRLYTWKWTALLMH